MNMPRKMTMDKAIVIGNVIRQLKDERSADTNDFVGVAVQRVTSYEGGDPGLYKQ